MQLLSLKENNFTNIIMKIRNPIRKISASLFTVCALFCTSLIADAGKVDDTLLGTWILRESAGTALKTDNYQWQFDKNNKFTLVIGSYREAGVWHLGDGDFKFTTIDEDGDETTQSYEITFLDDEKLIVSQFGAKYIYARASPKAK